MPSLKAIRKRISSVQSTQKITRAMKMVAGARLNRAQQRILDLRPYAVIFPGPPYTAGSVLEPSSFTNSTLPVGEAANTIDTIPKGRQQNSVAKIDHTK